MYTYVCIHRSACIHNCIYMRIYTHIYAYVNGMCMYVCAHVHVRASTPPGKAHAGRAVSVSSPLPRQFQDGHLAAGLLFFLPVLLHLPTATPSP